LAPRREARELLEKESDCYEFNKGSAYYSYLIINIIKCKSALFNFK
jgi:hypothetical protein